MITAEDRPIVIMMAAGIYHARIQAGEKSPDPVTVAAEASKLLDSVNRHMSPTERRSHHRKTPSTGAPSDTA